MATYTYPPRRWGACVVGCVAELDSPVTAAGGRIHALHGGFSRVVVIGRYEQAAGAEGHRATHVIGGGLGPLGEPRFEVKAYDTAKGGPLVIHHTSAMGEINEAVGDNGRKELLVIAPGRVPDDLPGDGVIAGGVHNVIIVAYKDDLAIGNGGRGIIGRGGGVGVAVGGRPEQVTRNKVKTAQPEHVFVAKKPDTDIDPAVFHDGCRLRIGTHRPLLAER